MKQFITTTIFIAVASIILMTFAPWWVVAIVGFVMAYILKVKAGKAFLSGLVAVSLVWIITAIMADSGNQISVAQLMSEVIGGISPSAVIIVTGLIGGLVCGFGAMTGSYTRFILKPNDT